MEKLLPDPNPILDEGAPTSTGGIDNAIVLCDVLGITLSLDPPRERYYQGWGEDCLGAKLIVCSWTLTTQDIAGKPTALTFDLVQGKSPLIIGQDIRQYCNTFNLTEQKYIRLKRPTDDAERYLYTYLVPGDSRLRLDVAPHPLSVKRTLLGNIHSSAKRAPLTLCKRIHRYTHATPEEMRVLCKDANMLDDALDEAIDKVFAACEVCAKNGRPKPSRKVSLTHVNEGFNEEVQIDFFYIDLRLTKYTVMNLTDTGTGFTEMEITADRNMETIIRVVETGWICKHGAPKAISADDEYNRKPLRQYLSAHEVTFKPRPVRRHNKTGIVERKNGTVKAILRKLNDEPSNADPHTLISRAAFLSNMFSGNRTLSSFELVRGYRPSVVGLPSTIVTSEILEAHKEQAAIRSLQRLLLSRAPSTTRKDLFSPNDPVWVFYKSSKQNEKVGWILATVVEAEDNCLQAKRSAHGRPMRVAYEDVRFAPRGLLTQELLSCSLEELLSGSTEECNEADPTSGPAISDARGTTNEPEMDADVPLPDEPPPVPLQSSLLATESQDLDCADGGSRILVHMHYRHRRNHAHLAPQT